MFGSDEHFDQIDTKKLILWDWLHKMLEQDKFAHYINNTS